MRMVRKWHSYTGASDPHEAAKLSKEMGQRHCNSLPQRFSMEVNLWLEGNLLVKL